MNQDNFVCRDIVKSFLGGDGGLCSAIDNAVGFLPVFLNAFSYPSSRQINFEALVLCQRSESFEPKGVFVERIEGNCIEGRLIKNDRSLNYAEFVRCSLDQVIDFRFVDTFELEGGYVYNELLKRQPDPIIGRIWEKLPFLPFWDARKERDPQFHEFLRHIANYRTIEVRRMLAEDESLSNRIAFMARPGHTRLDQRVTLLRVTAAEYAAEFGNRDIINELHVSRVLKEEPAGNSPLCWAAVRGNYETTLAMLDLGFDVEVTDKISSWPLDCAAACGRTEIVDLLLEHGAEINRQDPLGRTVLFSASSEEIIVKLLNAGANTEVVDSQGRTCVSWHNEHGRREVADLLVKRGAKPPSKPSGLNEQETMERGKAVLQAHCKHDPLLAAEEGLRESVGYGYVLPVSRIPIDKQQCV